MRLFLLAYHLPISAIRRKLQEFFLKGCCRRDLPEDVKNLAKEGVSESAQLVTKAHLSLTGASGKVGLYYDDKKGEWYLPIGNAPSTHIVKQSHVGLGTSIAMKRFDYLAHNFTKALDQAESTFLEQGLAWML